MEELHPPVNGSGLKIFTNRFVIVYFDEFSWCMLAAECSSNGRDNAAVAMYSPTIIRDTKHNR